MALVESLFRDFLHQAGLPKDEVAKIKQVPTKNCLGLTYISPRNFSESNILVFFFVQI